MQDVVYKDCLGIPQPQVTIAANGFSFSPKEPSTYWRLHSTVDELKDRHFSTAEEAERVLATEGWRLLSRDTDGHGACRLRMQHPATAAARHALEHDIEADWADAVPCYVRYGDLPSEGRSYNARDNVYEVGVSVFRGECLPDGRARPLLASNDQLGSLMLGLMERPMYVVDGDEVGLGADGEPLLRNCRVRQFTNSMDARFQDDFAYESVADLIWGVDAGDLLVHARVKDDDGLVDNVIEPMAGELLRSTEMYQTAEEMYGEGPDITCFADNFDWIERDFLADVRGRSPSDLEVVFVEKQPCIQRSIGDGRVEDAYGNVTSYELSPMGDHESDLFRSEPAGVEKGDWYTNQPVDVVAVVDGLSLRRELASVQDAGLDDEVAAEARGGHTLSPGM